MKEISEVLCQKVYEYMDFVKEDTLKEWPWTTERFIDKVTGELAIVIISNTADSKMLSVKIVPSQLSACIAMLFNDLMCASKEGCPHNANKWDDLKLMLASEYPPLLSDSMEQVLLERELNSLLYLPVNGFNCVCGSGVVTAVCKGTMLRAKFPATQCVVKCTNVACGGNSLSAYNPQQPPAWMVMHIDDKMCVNPEQPFPYCNILNGRCVSVNDGEYMRDHCLATKTQQE